MGRKRKLRRKGTAQNMTLCATLHSGGSAVAYTCMTASGTGSLLFIDDVTDGSSRMYSEVHMAVLSAQISDKC